MKDKVCVATGGAQGIGRAIAQRFADEGTKMVFALDVNNAGFPELTKGRNTIRGVVANVTDPAGIAAFITGRVLRVDGGLVL